MNPSDIRTVINAQKQSPRAKISTILLSKQVRLWGNSMLPYLDPARIDLLFISTCDRYKVGDIVVYADDNGLIGVSVHRIIQINRQTGQFFTKGDNVLLADAPITRSCIIGKIEKCRSKKDLKVYPIHRSRLIAFLSRTENKLSPRWREKTAEKTHRLFIPLIRLFTCYKRP